MVRIYNRKCVFRTTAISITIEKETLYRHMRYDTLVIFQYNLTIICGIAVIKVGQMILLWLKLQLR